MVQYSNLNRVIEARDNFKNEANSENLMSRGNILLRNYGFVLLMAGVIFSGCNKDENCNCYKDEPIGNDGIDILEISVVNGKDYSNMIDKVKLSFREGGSLTTADYNDGKFTLHLPETVAAGYLYGININNSFSSTTTISDPNAQVAYLEIEGYRSDKKVCRFYCFKEDEEAGIHTYGYLFYVNSALSITGTETETNERDITLTERNYTYSVHAKRGWNMWYYFWDRYGTVTEIATGIRVVLGEGETTTDPGGMKWFVQFYSDNDNERVTAGDEMMINAQVENGDNYNYIKRVLARGNGYALAVGNYSNGGFTLTIPNTTYPKYRIETYFFGNNINISNKSASMEYIGKIQGFSTNSGLWNGYEGDFIYGKTESNSETQAMFIFVDMDVNVTGWGYFSYIGNGNYSMNLKAGWNTVYTTTSPEIRTTSTTPVGNLKWYFWNDFYKMSPCSVKSLNYNNLIGTIGNNQPNQ